MGIYLNPTNTGFYEAVKGEIYIDKSELFAYTIKRIRTPQKFICVSRPRRFDIYFNELWKIAGYNN